MNAVNLIGNICNDIELKTTPNGKSVCSFNLAVKRPFAKETTDFLPIVCWDRQADTVSKYCRKGNKIGISGMMTSRKYQDRDGNNRTVFEVVANNVHFVDSRKDTKPSVDVNPDSDPLKAFADNNSDFVEVSGGDDLPF